MMTRCLALIIFVVFSVNVSFATKRIKVGAYTFVPYYENVMSQHRGLTSETVRILNAIQKEYHFELQYLPAHQRYSDLSRKRIDLYIFEDPAWEWSKHSYDFIPLDIQDGEVYITRLKDTPSPKNFEELKKMRIAVVKGFHYGFAGLNADERYLKKNFTIDIVPESETCISLVLANRSDVAVVAKSFIYNYFKKHPEHRGRLAVSSNYDSIYRLGVVFSADGRNPREKLESIIAKLKSHPEFLRLMDERFQ